MTTIQGNQWNDYHFIASLGSYHALIVFVFHLTLSFPLICLSVYQIQKTSLGNADWVSTGWDPNQVQRFVGPDPDPNRFVNVTSRQHKLVDIRWTSRSNGWFSHDRFQLLSCKMTAIEGRILT